MSLLKGAMELCTLLVQSREPDGYGAEVVSWADGSTFHAAVFKASDRDVRTAEAQGVTGVYSVLSPDLELHFHDVFRRADGRTFRITEEATDRQPPASASGLVRVLSDVMAEEWEIPGGAANG